MARASIRNMNRAITVQEQLRAERAQDGRISQLNERACELYAIARVELSRTTQNLLAAQAMDIWTEADDATANVKYRREADRRERYLKNAIALYEEIISASRQYPCVVAELEDAKDGWFRAKRDEWLIVCDPTADGFELAWYAPNAEEPTFEISTRSFSNALVIARQPDYVLEYLAREQDHRIDRAMCVDFDAPDDPFCEYEAVELPYGPTVWRHNRARVRIFASNIKDALSAVSEVARACGKFADSSYFDHGCIIEMSALPEQARGMVERKAARLGLHIVWY